MNPRISDSIRGAYQNLAAAFSSQGTKLSIPQLAVLRCLCREGEMNQTQLVGATGIDRSTVSDVLRRLALSHFLKREKGGLGDKRANIISITYNGRRAVRMADDALLDAETALMKRIDAKDRESFLRGLRAISEIV